MLAPGNVSSRGGGAFRALACRVSWGHGPGKTGVFVRQKPVALEPHSVRWAALAGQPKGCQELSGVTEGQHPQKTTSLPRAGDHAAPQSGESPLLVTEDPPSWTALTRKGFSAGTQPARSLVPPRGHRLYQDPRTARREPTTAGGCPGLARGPLLPPAGHSLSARVAHGVRVHGLCTTNTPITTEANDPNECLSRERAQVSDEHVKPRAASPACREGQVGTTAMSTATVHEHGHGHGPRWAAVLARTRSGRACARLLEWKWRPHR